MKKILFLASIFTMIISFDLDAQITNNAIYASNNYERQVNKDKITAIKRKNRTGKAKLRAMKKIAKADGVVTPREKAVIKQEKQKIKKRSRLKKQRKAGAPAVALRRS